MHVLGDYRHHRPARARVPARLRRKEQDRGPEPLAARKGDVPAHDGDERNGGFQVGNERPFDPAQVAAQVTEDPVDVERLVPHEKIESISWGFRLSTAPGFG